MKALLKKLFHFGDSAPDAFTGESTIFSRTPTHPHEQLNDLEIGFLRLLDGKPTDNPAPMGWWCSFHGIDGRSTLAKLRANGFLTLADYKVSVTKATVPILKKVLTKHGLPLKGKKQELVKRVIENVGEPECLNYFTTRYWSFTPLATELLHAEDTKAQEKYNRMIQLIQEGSYGALKLEFYPNRGEHWGTEDTFCDTIGWIMEHGFKEFKLPEEIRKHLSAFVAFQAVDYGSRSTCVEHIFNHLRSVSINLEEVQLPESLRRYVRENEIDDRQEAYQIYIEFIVNRARAVAELRDFRKLGIAKIRIDSLACDECGRRNSGEIYSISKAPLLPRHWNCQCSYMSVLRSG